MLRYVVYADKFLFLFLGIFEQMNFYSFFIIFIRNYKLRRFGIIVIGIALCHNIAEQIVDKSQNLTLASEICVKLDSKALSHAFITHKFVYKYFRVGKAKPVNRLLHVADHKARIYGGKFQNQFFLQTIYVLIFVNVNEFDSCLYRFSPFRVDKRKRHVLQIAERNLVRAAFDFLYFLVEFKRHFHKFLHKRLVLFKRELQRFQIAERRKCVKIFYQLVFKYFCFRSKYGVVRF